MKAPVTMISELRGCFDQYYRQSNLLMQQRLKQFYRTTNTLPMLFALRQPSFEILENEGTVELEVSGELTANDAIVFRSKLLKLLQHGKSKSYKLNLAKASAMDDSCIQLICTLILELTFAKTQLTIELPERQGIFDKSVF